LIDNTYEQRLAELQEDWAKADAMSREIDGVLYYFVGDYDADTFNEIIGDIREEIGERGKIRVTTEECDGYRVYTDSLEFIELLQEEAEQGLAMSLRSM